MAAGAVTAGWVAGTVVRGDVTVVVTAVVVVAAGEGDSCEEASSVSEHAGAISAAHASRAKRVRRTRRADIAELYPELSDRSTGCSQRLLPAFPKDYTALHGRCRRDPQPDLG